MSIQFLKFLPSSFFVLLLKIEFLREIIPLELNNSLDNYFSKIRFQTKWVILKDYFLKKRNSSINKLLHLLFSKISRPAKKCRWDVDPNHVTIKLFDIYNGFHQFFIGRILRIFVIFHFFKQLYQSSNNSLSWLIHLLMQFPRLYLVQPLQITC